MRLYSDFGGRRARQIIADLVAIGAIALWVWIGVTVHALIDAFASYGAQLESAGAGFRETMTQVGETLGGVPVIGGGIRAPFDGASGAGAALESAGQSQQSAVHLLALAAALGVSVLPILAILALWLIPRLTFAVRAGRAAALAASDAGLDLLAFRALAQRDLAALQRVDPQPLAAWRRGDASALRGLASLELRAVGVRPR